MGATALGRVVIHHNPAIAWHSRRVGYFRDGLQALGYTVWLTTERKRVSNDPAILFGTSSYTAVEETDAPWLLVDRACFGDPEYVRLGWNGRGLQADYCIPDEVDTTRIKELDLSIGGIKTGPRVVLCGDYDAIPKYEGATHYKPHPRRTDNPTGLPVVRDFKRCGLAVVGSSTVAFDALLDGRQIKVLDPNSMANLPLWQVAYTQWSWDEIKQGHPIAHLWQHDKLKDSKS